MAFFDLWDKDVLQENVFKNDEKEKSGWNVRIILILQFAAVQIPNTKF